MRKTLALLSVMLVILSAACANRTTVPEMTQPPPEPETATDVPIALPETTPAESEPPAQSQSQTEPPPVSAAAQTTAETTASVGTTAAVQPTRTPDSDSAAFTYRDLRYYDRYEENFAPTASVADSRKSLDDMLRAFRGGESQSALREEDFFAYTDEWFGTHRLIVVKVQESSGSIGHDVRKVAYTDSGASVTIRRTYPAVQTCDIAQRLILIELPDTRLVSADAVALTWEDLCETSTRTGLF